VKEYVNETLWKCISGIYNLTNIACSCQLISRALGGLTGPSDKGWGTGPRRTALADSEASEFLQSCARAYDRWQEALVQEHEKDFKGGELKLLPIEGAESKDTFNIFYSHQDQVMKPPPDLRYLGCFDY
jgi:GMP synthase-like glutamine amidotransferase